MSPTRVWQHELNEQGVSAGPLGCSLCQREDCTGCNGWGPEYWGDPEPEIETVPFPTAEEIGLTRDPDFDFDSTETL